VPPKKAAARHETGGMRLVTDHNGRCDQCGRDIVGPGRECIKSESEVTGVVRSWTVRAILCRDCAAEYDKTGSQLGILALVMGGILVLVGVLWAGSWALSVLRRLWS
jgi:hypothetical protein